MTPAVELRKAVEVLRCDHSWPINPPGGSIFNPGRCENCGVDYYGYLEVPDELIEPLADWLEEEVRQYDLPPCDGAPGVCNRCEWDPSILAALAVALAIRGGDAP